MQFKNGDIENENHFLVELLKYNHFFDEHWWYFVANISVNLESTEIYVHQGFLQEDVEGNYI